MGDALLTDLYELTMLQAYHRERMNGVAAFEFFVRALPGGRNFLVAAGLEQVLQYLESLRFTAADIEWLWESARFDPAFVASLEGLRFTGDVDAMPEGTVFFADEPILRIVAPLREAQLVESRVMNLLHFETLVASKAARVVLAARGRLLMDFGMRRAHGAEAALLSARASYLAGFSGTATLEAARRFGIPAFGTMAHSYVQAHESEAVAFESFARAHPENATLLIDTYDTERAAHQVVRLIERGFPVHGVRIDSGDLGLHAKRVRAIFDMAGVTDVRIYASGNLDEHRVAALLEEHAPIDGFGVGTRMNTSADAPFLDCAYKLQEYDGEPRRKRSEGKATWPGRKQVRRSRHGDGQAAGDLIAIAGEARKGEPLLAACMRAGRRVEPPPTLEASRQHAREEIRRLPAGLLSLTHPSRYAVRVDDAVKALADRMDRAALATP